MDGKRKAMGERVKRFGAVNETAISLLTMKYPKEISVVPSQKGCVKSAGRKKGQTVWAAGASDHSKKKRKGGGKGSKRSAYKRRHLCTCGLWFCAFANDARRRLGPNGLGQYHSCGPILHARLCIDDVVQEFSIKNSTIK